MLVTLPRFEAGLYLITREGQPVMILYAEPGHAQMIAKAGGDPEERWITLKPNGEDSSSYVHVKIRVHKDGSAHVLHGPGGLRGLKLNKLSSQAEIAARAKMRAAQKRKAILEQRANETPEQAQARQQTDASKDEKTQKLTAQIAEQQRAALEAAEALTGSAYSKLVDPETIEQIRQAAQGATDASASGKLAAGLVASQHARTISNALKQFEKKLLTAVGDDDDLRAAIVPQDARFERPEVKPIRGTSGFQATTEARKRGFSQDDAKTEAADVFQRRVQAIASQDPEKAQRMLEARQRMAEAMRQAPDARAAVNKTVPKPSTDVPHADLETKANDVRKLLTATKNVRDLQKELRRVQQRNDPLSDEDERGALDESFKPPLESPIQFGHAAVPDELAMELEKRIQDVKNEDLTRAFFDAVDDPGEFSPEAIRAAMRAPHAKGAYDHLNNVSLATLGADVMDRAVVDSLGVDAASKLIAHALRRDMPSADLERLQSALDAHHDQGSLSLMAQATSDADAARKAASGIETPDLSDQYDAAAAQKLIDLKRETLESAHHALGRALGQVEAGAALNLALRQPSQDRMIVNVNAPIERATLTMRALGLEDGEYQFTPDSDGKVHAIINQAGMNRLTKPAPPAELETARAIEAIKNGSQDEPDWLPHDFEQYPSSAFDQHPPTKQSFSKNPDFTDPRSGLESAIGQRIADGWSPAECARLMRSEDFIQEWVPPEKQDEFRQHMNDLMPATAGTETRKTKDGSYQKNIPVDYNNLDTKHPLIAQKLNDLAHNAANGDEFSNENVPDDASTRKAVYMAITAEPASQLAYKKLGDLAPKDQRAMRTYFTRRVLNLSPDDLAKRHEGVKRALTQYDQRNPEPRKFGGSENPDLFNMFGNDQPTDENAPVTLNLASVHNPDAMLTKIGLTKQGDHYTTNQDGSITLTDKGKTALKVPPHDSGIEGLDALNPDWLEHQRNRHEIAADASGSDTREWNDFVDTVGGPQRAYQAVQEHMRGGLNQRFAKHYSNLTGRPISTTVKSNQYGEPLWAASDPDAFKNYREQQSQEMQRGRFRNKGQFTAMGGKGSLSQKYRDDLERLKNENTASGALFGGQTDTTTAPQPIPHLDRHALAPAVEKRLAQMLDHARPLTPNTNPIKLIPDMTMGSGTKFVKQQRAIKALATAKKMALWLGTGSGKTSTALGAFSHLRANGQAKKMLAIVPSIVRDQFGEEAARTYKEGTLNWHAQDATYPERLAAYKDPDTHMIAVTHQAFRDDMLKMMGDHHQLNSTEMHDKFMGATRPERARLLREALESHGVNPDFVVGDEAHDFLNRSGKPEAMQSAILEAMLDHAPRSTLMTGSPIKNDQTELYDWLQKLDPARFNDRAAFMRRYDTRTPTGQEALKRLISRYTYTDVVPANTVKKVVWGKDETNGDTASGHAPIPLTDWQQSRLDQIEQGYQKARRAKKEGRVDVDAIKQIRPEMFDGQPASAHQAIAAKLNLSLGTTKFHAKHVAINEAPAEHNAKIQHALALANSKRGKGGVIFAHSLETVKQLEKALINAGHKVVTLTGEGKGSRKTAAREALDNGEADIIVSSDAGAVGANFQGRGEYVVNMDIPMTQMKLEQRNARIDRIGQTRAIELHHAISDSDYDRDSFKRIQKKHLLGQVFQGSHESLDDTGLSRDIKLASLGRPEELPQAADD